MLRNILGRTRIASVLRCCSYIKTSSEMDTERLICKNEDKVDSSNESSQTKLSGQSRLGQGVVGQTLSKKALKRIARVQKYKECKKQKREENRQLNPRDDVGCSVSDLKLTSYYFENGVRKVYPYNYVFATHAKGRWVGRRIQDVLETEFGYDQPDDLTRAFENGMIHVNGKQASVDYVLHDNDYVSHRTHRHENPVTAAPIEILENNDDLIVINKPSSIPCHPCGRYRFNSVVFILGKEMGLVNLRNIYRLDRLTSGVLILGKTPEKTKLLMDQVANRQVQKEYVCRVVGKFPDGLVKVDQPLKALSNKLRLQVISPTGKSSQTSFTRISYNGKTSVVRCIPHTGRTHQIRVHLQYLGHPILNDAFYNSDAWGPSRGKNGVYEEDFDKVCERILTEHHKSMWLAGVNPLYEKKLRELKGKEQIFTESLTDERRHNCGSSNIDPTDAPQSGIYNDSANPPQKSNHNNSTDAPQFGTYNSADAPQGGTYNSTNAPQGGTYNSADAPQGGTYNSTDAPQGGTYNSADAPQSSNHKDATDAQPKNCTILLSLPESSLSGNITQQNVIGISNNVSNEPDLSDSINLNVKPEIHCLLNCPTTKEQTSSKLQESLNCSASKEQTLNSLSSCISEGNTHSPAFEISKWSVDPSCDLCKRLSLDPEEKHLIMFLHAFKYKGPGWEYGTTLPEWASEEWNREEEFLLGTSSCFR